MLLKTTCALIFVCALSLPFAAGTPGGPHGPRAEDSTAYAIDPLHSGVLFRIGHLGVSSFYGRFNEVTGSYAFDTEDFAKSSVEVELTAGSVDSNSVDRDKHIKGPDFLNAKQFPKATFKSTAVEESEGGFRVTGDLTLRGKTNRIEFDARLIGSKETRMGYRSGFEGSFSIERSDYGMDSFPAEVLGERIELTFFIEGIRR